MFRTAFPTASQRIRAGHAAEEVERLDRQIVLLNDRIRAAAAESLARTGLESETRCVLDHVHDMLHDVFGDERKKLLDRLDEEGGDVTAYAWPIADDSDQPATVIPFPM